MSDKYKTHEPDEA